jgi:hypothetical protein
VQAKWTFSFYLHRNCMSVYYKHSNVYVRGKISK